MLNRFTDRAWVLAFSVIANFSIQPVLAQSPELSQEEIQRFTEETNALEKEVEAFLKSQSTTPTISSESHHSHCEVIIPPDQFGTATISVIFRGVFGDVNVGGDSLRRVAGAPNDSRTRTLRGSRPHSLWTFTPNPDVVGFERVFYFVAGIPAGSYPIEITGPLRGDPVTATVLLGSPQLGAGVLKLLGIHTLSAGQVQEVCTIVVGAVDTTVPGAVIDLSVSSPATTSLTLNWTAPGDDGNEGTAAGYDIRFRKDQAIVTDAEFEASSHATGEPSPLISGTKQTFEVSSLEPGTKYFFAIKTTDDAGNVSGISNSPEGRTCVEVAGVGDFNQNNGPAGNFWGDNDYDDTSSNIGTLGCAVSAVADISNFHGVNVDPGSLNTFLNNNNGYNGSAVNWRIAGTLPGSPVRFAGRAGDIDTVRDDIRDGFPVILELWSRVTQANPSAGRSGKHFVVAWKVCGDQVFIKDPSSDGIDTLEDYFASMRRNGVNVNQPNAFEILSLRRYR